MLAGLAVCHAASLNGDEAEGEAEPEGADLSGMKTLSREKRTLGLATVGAQVSILINFHFRRRWPK